MSALPYDFRLTEEIARWAFEVHVRRVGAWHIAFTNPTAGPWKRLMALNDESIEGEVHRFLREEERPDLVLVNDDLEAVVIVEAKDSLRPLLKETQVAKSCAVIQALARTLAGHGDNPFWGRRADYAVVPGLLWGSGDPTPEEARAQAFATYEDELALIGFEHPGLIAIEVGRDGDEVSLRGFTHGAGAADLIERVLGSLELEG